MSYKFAVVYRFCEWRSEGVTAGSLGRGTDDTVPEGRKYDDAVILQRNAFDRKVGKLSVLREFGKLCKEKEDACEW